MLRRVSFLVLLVVVLASSLLLALLVTSAAGSAPGTTCTAAQKAQRQRAVRTYQRKMPAARKAYFKAHEQAKLRAAFVKAQQAKLARLRQRRCLCCFAARPSVTASSDNNDGHRACPRAAAQPERAFQFRRRDNGGRPGRDQG